MVVDRENLPVSELVVDVAAVVLREQAGAFGQVHAPRVGAKCVAQRGEAVGRIADRELLADRLVHAAAVEIRARLVAAGQVLAEEMRRGFQRAEQLLGVRSEEHTSELQSLMRISYAVF